MTMNKLLIAASVLAIMAGAPALAETNTNADNQNAPSVSQDVKREWKNVKENASEAADKTAAAAEDAYESIKATVIGDEAPKAGSPNTVTIDSRMTAAGMIGQPVLNHKNEKIATVEDIILDADGNATTVVLANGGFMGIGTKLAAFDYSLVSQRSADGDVIMPISEETLKKVAPFSYEAKDAEKDKAVRIMQPNNISVAKLLDGQILDPEKNNVAEIDNISFRDGSASQVIVAFDQTLGLGGERAAMNFDSVKLVREDANDKTDVDVQLSAKQAANFENFKKTANN
jgi:sporulation protein YlmC with PRC-barrel domain